MSKRRFVTLFVLAVTAQCTSQGADSAIRLLPPVDAPAIQSLPGTSSRIGAAASSPLPVPQPAVTSSAPLQGDRPNVPEPISAAAPALVLSDLEGIALANNPALARTGARVQAARGEWLQVGLLPNPVAGYSAAEIGDEDRAGQQGGVVGQEIVLGHKLKLNRAVAAQQVRQAEQEFEAQRLRVLSDVRIQFYTVLAAQQKAQLADRLVRIGQEGVEAAQRLFDAQEVGRPDLLQARIEANEARITAQNARNGQLAAWRSLAAVLGMPEMAPAPLAGDLRTGRQASIDYGQALERILGTSPELAAAQANVQHARWAIDRARAEKIPNVDLQVTAQHDNATRDNIVGVQAVLPVPIWNRNQGGIAKAQAELSAASSGVLTKQLALQQHLAGAYERYANARQKVERYEQDILPDAQQSLDLVKAGYKQSEFSYLAVLTAQRTYFQTSISYLDALLQLRESSVEIDGLLLRGSLQGE